MTIVTQAQFDFTGGLTLTAEQFAHRGSPISGPTINMPTPELLLFALQNRRDEPQAVPCVSVGQHVLKGQPLSHGDFPSLPPILASCSGIVETVSTTTASDSNQPQFPHLALRTDKAAPDLQLHTSTEIDPAKPLHEKLYLAGIRGLGGAAFPAHLKLRQSTSGPSPIDTLIINAAECEPLIHCDEALMIDQAEEIIEAVQFLSLEIQSRQCLIGIESDKPKAIASLSAALEKNPGRDTKLIVVPARFPTGGERQLIKVLTNQEVPYQSHPASLGVLCLNVATVLAIKRALVDQQPLCSRIVSVTGSAIKQPANIRVTLGTPIHALLQFFGIVWDDAVKVTMGGPVSGTLVTDKNLAINAACNCLLIEATGHSVMPKACIRCGDCDTVCPQSLLPQQLYWYSDAGNHREAERFKLDACIECGCCDTVCPQSLLPQQLYWYSDAGNHMEAERFKLDACIECGCCDLVCPSKIPLTSVFRETKSTIKSQRISTAFAQRSKERFEKREQRLEQKEQQRQQRIEQRKAEIDARKNTDPKEAVRAALARAKSKKASPSKKSGTDKPAS